MNSPYIPVYIIKIDDRFIRSVGIEIVRNYPKLIEVLKSISLIPNKLLYKLTVLPKLHQTGKNEVTESFYPIINGCRRNGLAGKQSFSLRYRGAKTKRAAFPCKFKKSTTYL